MRCRRILIIGEMEEQVEDLQQVLEGQGHQVFAVGTSTDAVETCTSFRPHLVILDLVLPGPELLSLTKQLMMSSSDPSPTVLVTGNIPSSIDSVLAPGVSSGFFTLERFQREQNLSLKASPNKPPEMLH